MSQHKDVTLLTHSETDGTQIQTQEAGCHELHLTYPNIIAKPGEVLLRAVVVADLLVAASCAIGKRKKQEKTDWASETKPQKVTEKDKILIGFACVIHFLPWCVVADHVLKQ